MITVFLVLVSAVLLWVAVSLAVWGNNTPAVVNRLFSGRIRDAK